MKEAPKPSVQIRIVLNSAMPVYRQIADAIRLHCVAGDLVPGEKLPTVRELAASLGIHFNTVAEAYRVLADEGWLRSEGRRGATVLDRKQPRQPAAASHADEGSRIRQFLAELQARGFAKEWIRREVLAALETRS
jgi:DNA-binding transcriptional regulator YhcF (GntR family)